MTDQTSLFASRRIVPAAVDKSAVVLSSLCVLHCLALPVAAGMLPLVGARSGAEWAHKAMVLLAMPVSGYAAFIRGVHYRDHIFVIFVTLGLVLIATAAFSENLHDIEKPLTATGALLVAGSHLWRWRRHYDQPAKSEKRHVDKT